MNPLLDAIVFLPSVALLIGGAELFIENAERSGKYLGMSLSAISFIFAGAEPEELFASAIASLKGYPSLAFGNAVGTNITILALCLGLSALIAPLKIKDKELKNQTLLALASTFVIIILSFGGYSRLDGLILLSAYLLVIFKIFKGRIEKEEEGELKNLFFMFLGLILMSFGGDLMVDSAENLSEFLGISDTVFGATILALVTSAEMFSLTIIPALRGVPEIAIGGIMGSVVANNFATLGVAVLITPLQPSQFGSYFLFLLLAILLTSFGVKDGKLGRIEGSLLLTLYLFFIFIHFFYLP
jgi:cation:H+ antiporter